MSDLAINKAADLNQVTVGGTLTYTITVTNYGPQSAGGVKVTDPLPANTTFVSATPSQGTCAFAAGVVTCKLGTILNGHSATITITVTPNAKNVQTHNAATVTGANADPDPSNNSSGVDTAVLVAQSSAFGEKITGVVNSGPLPAAARTIPGDT